MKKEDSAVIRGVFSDRLSDLIKDSGKRIDELARDIGISTGILSTYQNDGAEAGITKLKKIADYFGVSTDYLLGGAECKSTSNEAIFKKTGLSDKSISSLELDIKPNDDYIFIVNALIESKSVKKLCHEISSGVKKSFSITQTLSELHQDFSDLGKSSYVFDSLDSLADEIDYSAEQYQEFLKYKATQAIKEIVDTTTAILAEHYEKIRNDEFVASLDKLSNEMEI